MKFRDLKIGETFDWIKPNSIYNSFYKRCVKTGTRTYTDSDGQKHRVGSINANVCHVGNEPLRP